MKTYYIFLILITNYLSLSCQDRKQEFSSGPANGTLIVIGGGDISESLNKKIMEISGGLQIPIVIIPTADGSGNYETEAQLEGLQLELLFREVFWCGEIQRITR